MATGRIWALPGLHDSRRFGWGETPLIFTFQTSGQIFRGDVKSHVGGPSFSWQLEGQAEITTDDTGEIDFGSRATRTHTLTVTPWSGLIELDLDRGNSIDQMYTGVMDFRMMTAMTDLDVDGELPILPGTVTAINLTGLTALTDFDMEHQALTSIVGLETCPSITTFDVNSNSLTELSFHASVPGNLIRFVVDGNPIETIDLSGMGASLTYCKFGGGGQPTTMPDFSGLTGMVEMLIEDSGIVTGTVSSDIFNANLFSIWVIRNSSMTELTLGAHTNADAQKFLYLNNFSQATLDALLLQHKNIPSVTSGINLIGSGEPSVTGFGHAIDVFSNGGQSMVDIPEKDLENDFTKVDPNERIVVNSASQVTFTGLTEDEDCYLYEDFGVDGIGGDFICNVKFKLTAQTGSKVVLLQLCNTRDDLQGAEGADARVVSIVADWGSNRIDLWARYVGTGGSQVTQSLGAGTISVLNEQWNLYLVKADREGANGAIYFMGDVIQSEPWFEPYWYTTYVDPQKIVCGQRVNHRYLMTCGSRDTNNGGVTVSGVIEDFRFWSA